MPNNKKLVILVGKDKLKSGIVVLGDLPKIEELAEGSWNDEKLAELLQKIKAHYQQPTIRIVFNEETVSTFEMTIPKGVENEKSFIGLKFSEEKPGILDGDSWDYEIISEDDNQKLIKIFAPIKEYSEKISKAALEIGLQIETTETSFSSKKRNSDPMIGVALKTLSEKIGEETVEGEEQIFTKGSDEGIKTEKEKKSFFSPKKIFFLGILFFFIALIVGIFVYLKSIGVKISGQKPNEPTVTQTMTVTPTLALVKKEDLKISIQNGGGKTGVAGVAKAYLEKLGYKIENTANAGSFDYERTEISIKDSKKTILEELKKDLSQKYSLSEKSLPLGEDNQHDIVIILGKN